MKKIIIALAALSLIASCTNTGAKSAEEYEQTVHEMLDKYSELVKEISEDKSLSPAEIQEMMEAQEEATMEELIEYSRQTIKRNRKDTLAVDVLSEVYYMMEVDELESTIKSLSSGMQKHPTVQKMKSSLAAKKATAKGRKFTDFEIDGVKFSDFVGNGKYVLVDFWASWCGPCKREIPNIKHVYETYGGPDFDVLSVAVWDKPEATVKAAKEHGVVWNQIINAQSVPTDLYGIDGIPHIMLIDPEGYIVARDLRGPAIEEAVREALGL